MSIESVTPTNHLILCRPLLLLPSVFPSIEVFSKESVLHIRWPKDWSFSFIISPSNEHSGLISFRMDWLDLLAVQGTLKSSPTPQFFMASRGQCLLLSPPCILTSTRMWDAPLQGWTVSSLPNSSSYFLFPTTAIKNVSHVWEFSKNDGCISF